MKKKIKRLLIIPARGGSKRIKNKNIRLFSGDPMIAYPIRTAIKSKLFDKIHISTDSKNIKKIINDLGLKFDFYRPKKLSDDHSTLIDVLFYTYEKFNKIENFDEYWCLLPCTPLINSKDLIKASRIFINKNCHSLITITKYPCPVEWSFEKDLNNRITPNNSKMLIKRSQDITPKYYDAGLFSVYSNEFMKKRNKKNFFKNFFGYEINKSRAIDIDDMEDWKIAESIFKNDK